MEYGSIQYVYLWIVCEIGISICQQTICFIVQYMHYDGEVKSCFRNYVYLQEEHKYLFVHKEKDTCTSLNKIQ